MKSSALFLILRRMRLPLLVLIAAYAVSTLGLVLMPGVDAEGRPHHLDFFHAFYIMTYTATTTGFGELPFPFTNAQRLWVTFSLYISVVAWLYALGALIALLRDPAFKQVISANHFARSVRRIMDPFYIVCGYGDTGKLVVDSLIRHRLYAVALDSNQDRLNELLLEDLQITVPSLCADASLPSTLIMAGLKHPKCRGVVVLTNDDSINLQIAITSKLLNPALKVICRAQTHDAAANMNSFGTDAVINPFDLFADRLAMALHSPDMHYLYEWMMASPGSPLSDRINPPRGTWILCGYGRFGKAVKRYLDYEGLPTVIIEKEPGLTSAPEDTIVGRGTEAVTLREAHIEQAVGIVAGTDIDANNLSIIVTARMLNPRLFKVARQNSRDNDAIFEAAKLDFVMQRAHIIASKILTLISTPLLTDFLRLARHHNNDWAKDQNKRLQKVLGDRGPELWAIRINEDETPVIYEALMSDYPIQLGHLIALPEEAADESCCMALLLLRDGEERLFPPADTSLRFRDQILFCGQKGLQGRMLWKLRNRNILRHHHGIAGLHNGGALWRRFAK